MKIVEIDEMSFVSVLANFTSEEIKIIKRYNQLISDELDKVSDDETKEMIQELQIKNEMVKITNET